MKLDRSLIPALCITCIFMIPHAVQTCTSFCLHNDDEVVFGKNYDWSLDDGILIVNKRNMSKTAMGEDHPAHWTSTYGSVTFNQYGRELPLGGMNEAGLVIETMWLTETEYPVADSRPAVSNLQWVQYQLDNSSTVEEVIASDTLVRIGPGSVAKTHYLVSDRSGSCASIEFVDGKLVYHKNGMMDVKTLTNSTYSESIQFLHQHKGFGGSLPIPQDAHSLGRFVRASDMLKAYDSKNGESAVDYAFSILASAAQGEWTQWSIVYDIRDLRIHFRTLGNPDVRYVDLDSLDFSCATEVRVVNLNVDLAGDILQSLEDYATTVNLDLVLSTFGQTDFLKDVPEDVLQAIARYPESTTCTE